LERSEIALGGRDSIWLFSSQESFATAKWIFDFAFNWLHVIPLLNVSSGNYKLKGFLWAWASLHMQIIRCDFLLHQFFKRSHLRFLVFPTMERSPIGLALALALKRYGAPA
jgi:hypothetical protein